MSVDYFDIEIEDTISTFGADNTLNACYFNDDAAACARIHRNPNGSLWRRRRATSIDLNINIGSLSTKGYDLNVTLHGSGAGPLRQPELQPDRHAAGRADHGCRVRASIRTTASG